MKMVHGEEKPYKCSECNAGFTQLGDVQRHVDRTHSENKQFHCEYCSSQFARNYELVQHVKANHCSKEEEQQVYNAYQCEQCQAIFFDQVHLAKHNSKVHQEQVHECHFCQRILKNKHDLKRHIDSVHEKKKPFMCLK